MDSSQTENSHGLSVALFWKLFLFVIAILVGHVLASLFAAILPGITRIPSAIWQASLNAVFVLIITAFFLRKLDGQRLRAVGIGFDRPWLRQILVGFLVGCGLVSIAWIVFVKTGLATWKVNESAAKYVPLFILAGVFSLAIAVYEETLCRGYVFQLLARWNMKAALAIPGIYFVVIHLPQTGGLSLIVAVNMFLAHLLYAVCYLRTRSLWLGIGIHFAWNFALATLYGMPISGRAMKQTIIKTDVPHSIWTGNAFGPEAGLVVTLVLAVAVVLLWRLLRQRHPTPDLMGTEPASETAEASAATIVTVPALAAPVVGPQMSRIQAIDVLRGLAILGILPFNMQGFAMHDAAVMNPYALGETDSLSLGIWVAMNTIFGNKDLMLFSMLFGAGILMISDRCDRAGRSATQIHLQRMAALMLVGLVHSYLLWAGDILFTYSICGLLVFWCRRFSASRLLWIGFGLYAVPMLLLVVGQFWLPLMPEELRAGLFAAYEPSAEQIADYYAIYRGSWWSQMPARAGAALTQHTVLLLAAMGWVAAGMMLVGMGMYRLGYLTAQRSRADYLRMLIVPTVIGLSLLAFGFYINFRNEWKPEFSFCIGRLPRELASPLMALGWIAAVMLLCGRGTRNWFAGSLAAVGQMALTNYLMHTILCSLIFYGDGFGLIGQVNRLEQALLSIAIWIAQLTYSPIWLRAYRFGPVEWLWRSMAYARLQPMKKPAGAEQ